MAPRIPDTDTRERILAAAAGVFAAHGFAGARIDDIAEKAGINKAMLYYHVGDKDKLYAAVLGETVDRAFATLDQSTRGLPTPAAKLENILETIAAFGTSNRWFVPIMLREISSGGRTLPDEMLPRMARIFRVVAEALAEGVESGAFRRTDPLLTHVSLIGTLMFLIASEPVRERLSRAAGLPVVNHTSADLAKHIGSLFLHGVLISPAPKKRSRRKT
ncbi:MAG: TetR/AcrR family transcriptional regulator [Thermoanaerobaculia bacterium]